MPDITMCRNNSCTKKNKCYRFTAEPNMRQSYSIFEGGENCEYFINNEK